jgi:leucyl aminopeptidase
MKHYALALIPILADPRLLKDEGIPLLFEDRTTQIAYAEVPVFRLEELSKRSHELGRCGAFERLEQRFSTSAERESVFYGLRKAKKAQFLGVLELQERPEITEALKLVSAESYEEVVRWFSSFNTRFNRAPGKDQATIALKARIDALIQAKNPALAQTQITSELLSHKRTPQKSLHVQILGRTRPTEHVVIGAHLDSVNWQDTSDVAPGADDNASGSAALFESLRIILSGNTVPERSLDFYWYAGEEEGLLGSVEIATQVAKLKQDVVGVMQLDMILHPGSGVGTIAMVRDFTNPWLNSFVEELNRLYVGARIVDDKCGYPCSDHAAWNRFGYPTVFPLEAQTSKMNDQIHTRDDVVGPTSSFNHAVFFERLAIAYLLELSLSSVRNPSE